MAITPEPWYVTERSEAFASILLSRRTDVHIWKKTQLDDRLVLHVAVNNGSAVSPQLFVVQVKGTMSADPDEWAAKVEPWFLDPNEANWLPSCVFVVNVRENQSFYAWLAEPVITDGESGLKSSSREVHFYPLDTSAVNQIVDQVKAWYAALQKQLQPA